MTAAIDDLVEQLRSDKEAARAKAWQHAYVAGPAALQPVAGLVAGTELEVGRAATRAMWKIVRHAGRPGADDERAEAVRELLPLLGGDRPRAVRAEAMWMLSEIGGDECVEAVAGLLSDEDVREDARMVLERIEGAASLGALKSAFAAAGQDFKPNLAQSLRRRGVEVDGAPCQKLVPTKRTEVKPVGRTAQR